MTCWRMEREAAAENVSVEFCFFVFRWKRQEADQEGIQKNQSSGEYDLNSWK